MSTGIFNDTINSVDYSTKGLTFYSTTDGTKTIKTIFDEDFTTVGTWIKDSNGGEESFSVKIPNDAGSGYVENGYYKVDTNDTGFSWTYNYDSSNAFTGGTESENGITTTLNASWEATSQKGGNGLPAIASVASKSDLASSATDGDVTLVTGDSTVYVWVGSSWEATGLSGSTAYYSTKAIGSDGDKEVTFFDASRDISGVQTTFVDTVTDGGTSTTFKGSSFFDASGEWIGDSYSDGFLIRSTAVKSDSSGGYTETGIYKETDGSGGVLFSRAFSYTFDSNGDLSSGSETVDGITTTYGANWEVAAKAVDVSALSITTADAPSDIPSSLAVSGKVYTTSQTQSWGDTEVTYYSAASGNASILGRAISFSNTENSIQNYGTTYFDEAWNWIGDVFTSGDWTARRFEQDNGNGTKTETGFETDGSGWSREWVFVFKTSNGEFVSGTETQNGVTTTFGANWQIVSKSADLSSLGELTDATALSDIPTSFVLTRDNNGTSEQYALFKTTENPWGDETTYFNAAGEIIGNAFGWSYGNESGTSFNDLNGNFLGDVYIQGDRKHIRFETEVTSDGTYGTSGSTIRLETGAEYKQLLNGSWDLERSWNFYFDNNFNMLGGTETMDGITTTFGQGWQIGAVKADTSALTAIADLDVIVSGDVKLSDLYTFTASVDGTDVTAGYQSTPKTNDWGDTEVVYYDAAGAVVGRSQQYSFTFEDMGGYGTGSQSPTTKTQTGTTYFDNDWNWVGDVFDDGTFSGSRFEFDLSGGGRRELGSETDGNWSRSYDFTYGANGVLVSGSETENGITTEYGADWTVTGRTADTSNLSQETNASVLADLPSSFVINNTAYYTENSGPWGTERTYFDASGTILGYSNSWSDNWGSGTSFNTADWEFLGDIFIQGDYKNVRFETKETSDGTYGTAGDTIRVETGVEYTRADSNSDWVQDRSWTFNFSDQNFDMLGGTETRADGTILTFGANWQITAEKADISSLTAISDMAEDLGAGVKLNELFDFSVTVDGQPVTSPTGYYKTEVLDFDGDPATNDGSKTVYFNQNAEIVGRKEIFLGSPSQEDLVPPLVFARGETVDGYWIDFMGIGIEGLADNYTNGEGVLIPLGWHSSVTIDENTTSQDILDMLGGSVDFEDPIPSGLAYSPNTADWLLAAMSSSQLTDITVAAPADASGVISGTIKGFIAKDINDPSPTAGAVIDVQYSSSDSLEYEYFMYDGGQFFTDSTTNTSFSVENTAGTFVDVIAAHVARVNANPPTNVQYFDEDFMWVGENFSSANDSRTIFNIENADGTRKEFGSEGNAYYSRSWEFNFDANGNFQGGTETENGVLRNVDEFGKAELQSIDPTSLSQIDGSTTAGAAELAALPSALYIGSGASAKGYYFEQKYPGGVETFYFDAAGAPLGRSQSFEDPYGGSGTDYFDASETFLGNTFSDGQGFSQSRFETRTGQGDSLVINEVGTEYQNGQLVRSWNFTFDKDFILKFGTETFGDRTTEFGANWTFIKETVTIDSSYLALGSSADTAVIEIETGASSVSEGLVKLSDILNVDATTLYKVNSNDWDSDGSIDQSETTYYNASGDIIGRKIMDVFTFTDPRGQTITQSNHTFFDKDWNWKGDYSSEGNTLTRAFFEVQTDANTKYELNIDFNRKSVFEYNQNQDGNFEFAGGFEIDNGTKYNIGANWNRIMQDLDQSGLDALLVNAQNPLSVELSDLPDIFKGTNDAVYQKVLFEDQNSGGKHVEFFNGVAGDPNFGKKIGEAFTFTDFWSGETVTSFNDANYDWLGDVRITKDAGGNNVSKFVFQKSDGFVDANGNNVAADFSGTKTAVEVETQTQYSWSGSAWVAGDTSTFNFDPTNYNLVSGSETRGGSTTKYGANWQILGETTDTSSFAAVSVTELAAAGNTVKITDLFPTAVKFDTQSNHHGSETKYFDANQSVVGYKYENVFVDQGSGKTFLNIFFEDGDRNWVGDARFDGDTVSSGTQTYSRSQSFFQVDDATDYSPDLPRTTEYFAEEDTSANISRSEIRTYEVETVAQPGGMSYENLIPHSGSITENGTTTTLSVQNGMWVRSAATVNLGTDSSIITITDGSNTSSGALPDFAEISPAFINNADDFSSITVDTAFAKMTRDDSAYGGGKEFTFFDASGAELGTAYAFTDYWSQEQVVDYMKEGSAGYPMFLGSVRESANRKIVRFETESTSTDGSEGSSVSAGDKIITEVGKEYVKESGNWVIDNDYTYVFDSAFNLLSGTQSIGGNTITYGENWVITGSQYSGTSGLQDLNIPFVSAILPEHWKTKTIKVEEEVRSDNNWDISMLFTVYEQTGTTGNEVNTKIGSIDLKGDFINISHYDEGFTTALITIMDADDVTQIGSASVATDTVNGERTTVNSYTSPATVTNTTTSTPGTGKKIVYSEVVQNTSTDVVISDYAYVDYEDSDGNYAGGSVTNNGFTEFYDQDGNATGLTNTAPTVTVDNPTSGNNYAGVVIEDGSASEQQVTDTITVADVDGNALNFLLLGSTSTGDIKSLKSQYGELSIDTTNLNSNGKVSYTYTLDNDNQALWNLNDGQYLFDYFYLEAQDLTGQGAEYYHRTFKTLEFAIQGADEAALGPFSIDLSGNSDVSISGYGFNSSVNLVHSEITNPNYNASGTNGGTYGGTSGYTSGGTHSTSYVPSSPTLGVLSLENTLVLDSSKVRETINRLDTDNPLSISVDLDKIANTNMQPETHTICIKIRDKNDSNAFDFDANTNERQIKVEFDVEVTSDGQNASVKALTQSAQVEWNGSVSSNNGIVNISNGAADIISIQKAQSGSTTVNSPQSLNIKLDTLLAELSGITNIDMLTSAGTYALEISGLGMLLDENVSGHDTPIDMIRGEIEVQTPGQQGSTSSDKFSLDLSNSNDITVQGDGFSASANLAYDATTKTLEASSPVTVDSAVYADNINKLGTTNPLSISVALDNIANTSGQTDVHEIEVVFRDMKDNDPFATNSATEREISVAFKVKVNGDGQSATLEAIDDTVDVTWYGVGDTTANTTTLTNVEPDFFTVSQGNVNSPQSLNLKLNKLLGDLNSITSTNMLTAPGNYSYQVKGLDGLLAEQQQNGSFADVDVIQGEIQIATIAGGGSSDKFSINLQNSNDVTITGNQLSASANLLYSESGGVNYLTADAPITVESSKVRDNINRLDTSNPFGISLNLDSIANTNGVETHTIEVIVTDKKDSNIFVRDPSSEREISVTFDVKVDGDGSSATIEAIEDTVVVNWYGAGDTTPNTMTSLTNSAADFLTVSAGNVTSPQSLNLKLDKLLNDLNGITNVDMLSSPGNYAYQIKGLGNLLAEGSNDVDVVRGEINVTGSQTNDVVDIAALKLAFDSPGNGSRDYTLDLSQGNNGQGDTFTDIALKSGDLILATDINSIGAPGVSFAPSITMTLGSAIDTSVSGPQNKTVSIEILEIDRSHGNESYNRDQGERKVEVQFDLVRTGDGTQETWSSVAGDNMIVNVWEANTAANGSPDVVISNAIVNSGVDSFTAIENSPSQTPNSMEIKLDEVLKTVKAEVGGAFPIASTGDEFLLTVSFLENTDYDTIIAGEFILS